MNSSIIILFIAIVAFCSESSSGIPRDILINPKDDCGNVCGIINVNNTNSKCDDIDKRSDQILVKLDTSDNIPEEKEYGDLIYYSCVAKCPDNYELYKSFNICVKDAVEFEKELIALDISIEVISQDSISMNKARTEDLNNDSNQLNDKILESSTVQNLLSTKIQESIQDSNPFSTEIQNSSQDSNPLTETEIQDPFKDQNSTSIVKQQENSSNNKLAIMWTIFGCLAVIILIN